MEASSEKWQSRAQKERDRDKWSEIKPFLS